MAHTITDLCTDLIKPYIDSHAGGGGSSEGNKSIILSPKTNHLIKPGAGWTKLDTAITSAASVSTSGMWTDGKDLYYSSGTTHYKFNKSTKTWDTKSWSGLTKFDARQIWSDGYRIYYNDYDYDNSGWRSFFLDTGSSVGTSGPTTWYTKNWSWSNPYLYGEHMWTDGENIYYSYGGGNKQYIFDKETQMWNTKTWYGELTNPYSEGLWSDGENIYHSLGNDSYVLDKETSTWHSKTWNFQANILSNSDIAARQHIWTDGENVYFSSKRYSGTNYDFMLDKETNTWKIVYWLGGITYVDPERIWSDGENIYCHKGNSGTYVLNKPIKPLIGTNF